MKLISTLVYLSVVATVIFAVSVIRRAPDESAVAVNQASRPTKVNRGPVERGGKFDVLSMTPAAWEERFERNSPSIPPETREHILHLSGELQESLADGTDPRSEEARVYMDAIRELLDYRGE